MNIGNRKKKQGDEFLPEWEKKCGLKGINCDSCNLFDDNMQWCRQYLDERIELLKQGKKLRKA